MRVKDIRLILDEIVVPTIHKEAVRKYGTELSDYEVASIKLDIAKWLLPIYLPSISKVDDLLELLKLEVKQIIGARPYNGSLLWC